MCEVHCRVAAGLLICSWIFSGARLMFAQKPQAMRSGDSLANTFGGSYRIAGVVVNAITGEPVRRATVAVLAIEGSHTVESVVSDSEGRFSLGNLPAAKYQLTASKRGFRTGFYDEHDEFSSAIVTGPDQDTSNLRFCLTPDTVLLGVVSSEDGDPVEGARVLLFERPKRKEPGERITQADATVTDDTGAYEFDNLAAGEYLLAVVAQPWYAMYGIERQAGGNSMRPANPSLDVAYPVTYFDSTADEAGATPIMLMGGSRQEANISLHAVPALHLSVVAGRRPDGSIARAELQQTVFGTEVSSESAGFLESIQTGTIEMAGVAPGHYQLTQGDPQRVADLDLSASQRVDPDAGTPAVVVSGTLRMASGMPAPKEVNLTMDRFDGGLGLNQLVSVARNGRFKFAAVTPGSWTLSAENGGKAMAVISTNGEAGARSGNTVTVRDKSLELGVTVTQGETRIEGFARKDGKAVAGAMLLLAPRDREAWQVLTRRDQSDSDGSFALRDVVAGQYAIVAIEDGWKLDWSSHAVMARYLAGGTPVTVTENSGPLLRLSAPVKVQPR
jgi:hypothetical protein